MSEKNWFDLSDEEKQAFKDKVGITDTPTGFILGDYKPQYEDQDTHSVEKLDKAMKRRLYCDYEAGEYGEEGECMNDATGIILYNTYDPVEDVDVPTYITTCDDHGPEMLHELKQSMGQGEFLMTAHISNVTDRSS